MPKKYLGQNFLFDPSILSRIIEAAKISPDDIVVEIGPGHGRLTKMLAETARKVVAIELDADLYEKLREDIKDFRNIELIHANALKYRYEDLEPFKVVANIPYYITTPIIFRLIESRKNLKSMTLTIQKEVAQRIRAMPNTKDYGVLTIGIQYFGKPELKFIIPRGAFRPVPKVDSALIHVDMLQSPAISVRDEKMFFRVVKIAFSQRRKTMLNAMKQIQNILPQASESIIKDIIISAGIDPVRRAETLSIEEFARLSNGFSDEKLFKFDNKTG